MALPANQPSMETTDTIVSVDGGVLPPTKRVRTPASIGYDWADQRAGQALAHALLAYEFGADIADRWYKDFARTVIAQLPYSGENGTAWTITSADLQAWLDQRRT